MTSSRLEIWLLLMLVIILFEEIVLLWLLRLVLISKVGVFSSHSSFLTTVVWDIRLLLFKLNCAFILLNDDMFWLMGV